MKGFITNFGWVESFLCYSIDYFKVLIHFSRLNISMGVFCGLACIYHAPI